MAVRTAIEKTVILAVGGTFGAAPFTGSRYTIQNNKITRIVNTLHCLTRVCEKEMRLLYLNKNGRRHFANI